MAAYDKLVERFKKLHRLNHLSALATWDQAAMMPSGSNQARSEALAEMSTLTHELLTASEVGDWIEVAREESLDDLQKASLREMERQFEQTSVMPADLVKAKSLAASGCEHAWRSQRPENDWQGFSKNLEKVLKLTREEASIRSESSGVSPYDAMLELYEPGVNCQQLDTLFGDVKQWLPDYVQQATERHQSSHYEMPEGPFATDNLKALGQEVMTLLGFDFNRGRLDVSAHPFCGGVSEDVRITTRYRDNDFIESLMGVVHETGHARYEQNRPAETLGLPVSNGRSMGIHEGQSLFFEMQIGRSREFLALIRPLLLKHLTGGEELPAYQLNNLETIYRRVQPGFIRVEADEVTYPAHIILRYEIEKALISGDMTVSDLPDTWHEKMQQYLNLSTEGNYKDGCMQDIHWPLGAFGYFPSYTLGAMYAAQLFATIQNTIPDVHAKISSGELSVIFDWLKDNIWSQGSRYSTSELITRATGEDLNASFFKEHLKARYLTD
ncbi:peptidase M32 [Endozoicomonas montiporae]|uniref:Metal-dependent carboxypeptidase n=1 Tax=Endozoicomonas montiporae TaxID=1027273 RepID=A0A081N5E4_9GAMM|nr:peptidase M32 [Endozoicomonas montiporae]